MYDQTPVPQSESGSSPSSFIEIWIAALTKPTEETFRNFTSSPQALAGTAFLWVAISGAISFFFYSLVNSFTGANQYYGGGDIISSLTCFLPISLVFTLIGFAICVGYSFVVGRALGGKATFDQLAYAMAAYMAPLGLAISVISVIPYINCLGFVLVIYGIVLSVLAVKAAHGLEWGQAVLASPVIIALALILCALCVIVIMIASGAALSDVFQDIINQLNQTY